MMMLALQWLSDHAYLVPLCYIAYLLLRAEPKSSADRRTHSRWLAVATVIFLGGLLFYLSLSRRNVAIIQMNVPRAWHQAVKLSDGSGRVLIAGGAGWGSENLEIYDPQKGIFVPGPEVPIHPVTGAALLRSGQVLLVGDNGLPGHACLYDPKTNQITETKGSTAWGHDSWFAVSML
ncbi:MAG TPA: hypothetical protein VMW56_22660, partial [Candidatus Margulisiibacteriota bacterium]|nr:hypothetical protein [Candidatus Margulisiibacteriota bacterium]